MNLRRVLDGLVVVAIGVVLLGNTFGVIPWSVWWNILALWPLLLVAAGIDIIGKSLDNTWLRLLSGLLVLGGIAYGVFIGMGTTGGPNSVWVPGVVRGGPSREFSYSEPADPAVETGEVRIEGGVGSIDVRAGADLLAAEGTTPFGAPVFRLDRNGSAVDARVGPGGRGGAWPFGRESRMEVSLGRDVRWDVRLASGVSSVDADFSDIDVASLRADVGVSTANVTLGAPVDGGSEARIDTGVSTINLRVPGNEAVEIVSKDGLATVNVPDGYERVNDDGDGKVWRSTGFAEGQDAWIIHVDAGVATVNIDEY